MINKGFKENYKYIFAQDGLYGGNQCLPKENPGRYNEIVRRYYKYFTDEQIEKRLYSLYKEGCRYVALVNSIFLKFYGQEEHFHRTFGLPMYDADGNLNFNDLLVDFYCATDNHNKCLFFDYLDVYEDDPEPNGTSVSTSQWRFERYMKKHGITAKLKRIRLEPENIEKCIEDGPIIVSVKPTTLYDKEGNIMLDKKDGHSMSVVGFCDNGFIKVSSWGKEYYIKPGSYTRFEYYQQVIFYDK